MQLQPSRKGPMVVLTENSFLSVHFDSAGEGMESDSDSNGFEDEVIGNVSNTKITFSANDLLKSNLAELPKTNNETGMKAQLQELLNANLNENLNKVVKFLLEYDEDKNAWSTFASCLRSIPLEWSKKGFQILFDRFPYSGLFVRMYCEKEEEARHLEEVKEILKKKLPTCVSIDLWVYYCNFFKKYYLSRKVGRELIAARAEVEQAFSFAVDTVGFFIDSDDLWTAYRSFLEEQPRDDRDINAMASFISLKRKFYHRAVVVPFHQLEGIWNEYSIFEESVISSRDHNADERKRIADRQKQLVDEDHKLAADVYKERSELWQYLTLDDLPMHTLTKEAQKQVDYWKKAIEYDESNPMKLPVEQLYHQVHMTYLRCLSCCYYCPDVWLDFAAFEAKFDWKRATGVVEAALRAIPQSVFLRLACCDLYEQHAHLEEAEAMYEELLRACPCALAWIQYQRFVGRQKGVVAARALFKRACAAMPDPEIFIAAADMEFKVNRLPTVAINVYRSGLPRFASSLRFVTSFAECLVQARQVEAALALLAESVAKMAKEEEKQALWEKVVEVRARFCMMKPIGEVLGVEAELLKQLPREENACVLSDLTRYTMWGCSFESEEDKSLMKRKYPFVKKEEEPPAKTFEASINLVAADSSTTVGRVKTELPPWLNEIFKKLPIAKTRYARDSSADELMRKLKKATIPTLDHLYLGKR